MTILLSILLLLLFALGFWIVKESTAPTFLKIVSITLFFLFCVVLGVSIDSSLGWATSEKNLPEIVVIRHVVVKEPNPQLNFSGSIYLLLDVTPSSTHDSTLLSLFKHKPENMEPRLFRLPYSRSLHEQIQNEIIPRLMKGQLVRGKFGKGGKLGNGEPGEGEPGDGNGKGGKGKGKGNGRGGRGGGSESLEKNDMMFYELPPSYFLQKR